MKPVAELISTRQNDCSALLEPEVVTASITTETDMNWDLNPLIQSWIDWELHGTAHADQITSYEYHVLRHDVTALSESKMVIAPWFQCRVIRDLEPPPQIKGH
mmetsp:Transcript_40558/g.53203  ORF Transcript_40558/g.53203 Transcript_40558/m.53203 type:complete len:103 (+) Transcript_40558:999-1307(+)